MGWPVSIIGRARVFHRVLLPVAVAFAGSASPLAAADNASSPPVDAAGELGRSPPPQTPPSASGSAATATQPQSEKATEPEPGASATNPPPARSSRSGHQAAQCRYLGDCRTPHPAIGHRSGSVRCPALVRKLAAGPGLVAVRAGRAERALPLLYEQRGRRCGGRHSEWRRPGRRRRHPELPRAGKRGATGAPGTLARPLRRGKENAQPVAARLHQRLGLGIGGRLHAEERQCAAR